ETPNLDALLTRGLVLDDHRSCSNWTFPSMICGLAGSGPIELEFAPVATPTESPADLPDSLSMMGDLLRDKGYASQGIITSPFLSPDFNGQRWDQAIFNIDFTGEEIVTLMLEQAERLEATGGHWALHGHFMDPHAPFAPPEEYIDLSGLDEVAWDLSTEVGMEGMREGWDELTEDERQNALETIDRLYSADVRYLDDQLGILMAGLEKLGVLDDAYVLVFSDHGEQFMEHGG
ncbi:MAG: sulfatase-like hydrolase/transferase, partial [Proteobacteria bacterium]|nr:sulfatase-like hydrolase/transferase [Pseudomonadota bacterium]